MVDAFHREFPTEQERRRLDAILEKSDSFLNALPEDATDVDIAVLQPFETSLMELLFENDPSHVDANDQTFFIALKGIISYLVAMAHSRSRIHNAAHLMEAISKALQNRMETSVVGYGTITFKMISELRQTYWTARRNKSIADSRYSPSVISHPSFPVLRINNFPFAESIFAELMSLHAGELAYKIDVVDVPWSEVGMALYTNRIDVALYNGWVTDQIKGIEYKFDRKLIFRSEPLYRYKTFPIIQSLTENSAPPKICVPWKSDFEFVVRDNITQESNGIRAFRIEPTGDCLDPVRDINYCTTADEALEQVIIGKAKYCIVGGIQAHYACHHFSERIRMCTGIDWRSAPYGAKGNAHFWVAVDRRDQAQKLIASMVTIWNDHVARGWARVGNSNDLSMQRTRNALVEFINAQPHRVFVNNFEDLKKLISDHDDFQEDVGYGFYSPNADNLVESAAAAQAPSRSP